ncbi:MAG: cytochrome P450 [Actinomycetota bacterium]
MKPLTPDVEYNPFDPGYLADPYPKFAQLRDQRPIYTSPLGFTVLFRHEDVLGFLRDPSQSVEDRHQRPTPMTEMIESLVGDRMDRGSRAMLNVDPPDHTRLRKLVSKAFTPKAIEALRPQIGSIVDEALAGLNAGNEIDVIESLAFPVPFAVICDMLGMPETDRDNVRAWSHLLVKSLEPLVDPELVLAIAAAGDNMQALVSDVIAWKRTHPADDMLSALIRAEEHGDVLSDTELLDQVMLLFIAGHETTVNLIGNGTLALLRNPGALKTLRDEPSLDANAVEELLRYDSPVQMSRRITLRDVRLGDETVPEGSFVVCVLASANRDPAHWGSNAGELDLRRENASQHLSFGGGHHYCLGAALARIEGHIAIGELIRRFPNIALTGEPESNGRINLRGLSNLPVTL